MFMYADSWRGPYRNITSTFEEAVNSGEDPDMFRTARGWHILSHNTGPASTRMWFSKDGIANWTAAPGSASKANAFNGTVRFTNGTDVTFCQRQRPQVVFASDGMPGWLWTGVMDGPGPCPERTQHPHKTWTLVQQIGRPSDAH